MSADWRNDILRSLPDGKRSLRVVTFESAIPLIHDAAFNRRMFPEDFIARAALAVAVYDLGETWANATRAEPPIRDLRRHGLPPRRLYGRNFGHWTITEMT